MTRVLPLPGSDEHTEGCPGCTGERYYHNAECRRRAAQRGRQASPEAARDEPMAALEDQPGPAPQAADVGGSQSSAAAVAPVGEEQMDVTALTREPKEAEAAAETEVESADEAYAEAAEDDMPQPHTPMQRVSPGWRQEYDEDDGTPLDPDRVAKGVARELAFMDELGVGEDCPRPTDGTKVWSCRWCHRRKGDEVRSRYVVRQFRDGGVDHRAHAGTPGPEAVRILLILSIVCGLFAATADFSVAFMHTPLEEEVLVEPPPELGRPRDVVWRLKRALYGLRCAAAAFQRHLCRLLESVGFRRGRAAQSIYYREADGVRMSVHVDDPLAVGPHAAVLALFEYLRSHIAVKVVEELTDKAGVTYLGMLYRRIPGGFVERIPPGYISSMAEALGVVRSKPPVTPGVKVRHLKPADEAPLDPARHRLYRGIVGRLQWILRVRVDLLYAVKELSRWLQAPREVDSIAAKRVVKYALSTSDYALTLVPTPGQTLVIRGGSDSDWAGCPYTRNSSSGAMVFLNGALVSALCRTQTVRALSSPEAEYYACCVGIAEAKYVRSLLADWGFQARMYHEVDASSAIVHASRIGLGGIRHMDVRFLWVQDEVAEKRVEVRKIRGDENPTDLATKHVDAATLQYCQDAVGLRPWSAVQAAVLQMMFHGGT